MSETFADKISEKVLKFFDGLPKSGKPNNETEWTILSAIIQSYDLNGDLEIVALATGTKCIGFSQMSEKGDILNDSHAEICCRRAFLRYLLWGILEGSSIFHPTLNGKWRLRENIRFHFYSTAVPCGDANIFQVPGEDEESEPSAKRVKLQDSAGFTGAKLIKPGDSLDEMEQIEGAIRVKPGKGERTLSLSCSDKIARWNIMGIQGCMLYSLLEAPIYLHSFILSDGVPYNEVALKRALYLRYQDVEKDLKPPFKHHYPELLVAGNKMVFQYSRSEIRVNPSATSIIWAKVPAQER
jgi:tRNA-specific adenosine deaminase 1